MALVRWEPTPFPSEMNRLLTSFFDTPTAGARRWTPAMDLTQTGEHLVLTADVPGLTLDDVRVTVEDGVLHVAGERRIERSTERDGVLRSERAQGTFRRSLRLPRGVDAEAIEASLEHGVLEVRVPKPAARQPRQVPIAVGGTRPAVEVEATSSATDAPEPAAA